MLKAELNVPASQALALFMKAVRKIVNRLQVIQKAAISVEMDNAGEGNEQNNTSAQNKSPSSDEDEQADAGANAPNGTTQLDKMSVDETPEQRAFREKQRELISSLDLSK